MAGYGKSGTVQVTNRGNGWTGYVRWDGPPKYPNCSDCGKRLDGADYSEGACRNCGEPVPSDW